MSDGLCDLPVTSRPRPCVPRVTGRSSVDTAVGGAAGCHAATVHGPVGQLPGVRWFAYLSSSLTWSGLLAPLMAFGSAWADFLGDGEGTDCARSQLPLGPQTLPPEGVICVAVDESLHSPRRLLFCCTNARPSN